jgi:S1-C subfamily serine protease
MTWGARVLALATAATVAWGAAPVGAARAAEWAPASLTVDGTTYDVDLASVSLNGAVVKSWSRHVLAKPARDPKTGAAYASETQERFDDCANRRFMLGTYVLRDAAGKAVGGGPGDVANWREATPGSIAESVARTVCAVAHPPKDEVIEPDLHKGSWTDLGPSADGKFSLQVRLDGIVKIKDGPVIAVWRSLYDKPEWIEGMAVRIVVSASAIDCAAGKSAGIGADFYISPNVRVRAARVAEKDLAWTAPGPNSYLAKSLKLVCASAQTEKAGGDDGHAGGLSVGTAWGADKGYLVTASHVIAGGHKIHVFSNGEEIGLARVMADDPANDLAVLKLMPRKPGKILILPIAPRTASLGRSVFTLGFPEPDALGQRVKMTAGHVSSTAGYRDDARYLQISVPVQEGNSGGPLIGPDGAVVGVIEAKLLKFDDRSDNPAPENINYALKSFYIRPMLEDLPDLANYTVIKPQTSLDQLVAEARKAVFMVVVEP